jgi:hypothetical protein
MMIMNLTQHVATDAQIKDGVVEPQDKDAVKALLTFTEAPTREEIERRAAALARVAEGCDAAMIGGAPYLMAALEAALVEVCVQPLYSFTERRSVEETAPDGTVRKVSVFTHTGWVEGAKAPRGCNCGSGQPASNCFAGSQWCG